MIEIGQHRMIAVRERVNGKFVTKRGPDGSIERRMVEDKVERVTHATLGGSFGSDRRFKLRVRLLPGDLIEIGPSTTRRRYTAEIKDVYRWLILRYANLARLEKARAKKAKKAERRESARLDRAEIRFRKKLKEEAQ